MFVVDGYIDSKMARRFSRWLSGLADTPEWFAPHAFCLDTEGGLLEHAYRMADDLRSVQKHLPIHCHIRKAWSAGTILVCAVPRALTTCSADASMMIHSTHDGKGNKRPEAERLRSHHRLSNMMASRGRGSVADYFRMIEGDGSGTKEYFLHGREIVEERFASRVTNHSSLLSTGLTVMPWTEKTAEHAPAEPGSSTDDVATATNRYRVRNRQRVFWEGTDVQAGLAKLRSIDWCFAELESRVAVPDNYGGTDYEWQSLGSTHSIGSQVQQPYFAA